MRILIEPPSAADWDPTKRQREIFYASLRIASEHCVLLAVKRELVAIRQFVRSLPGSERPTLAVEAIPYAPDRRAGVTATKGFSRADYGDDWAELSARLTGRPALEALDRLRVTIETETWENKDLWKPLNSLAKAAQQATICDRYAAKTLFEDERAAQRNGGQFINQQSAGLRFVMEQLVRAGVPQIVIYSEFMDPMKDHDWTTVSNRLSRWEGTELRKMLSSEASVAGHDRHLCLWYKCLRNELTGTCVTLGNGAETFRNGRTSYVPTVEPHCWRTASRRESQVRDPSVSPGPGDLPRT